MRIPLAPDAYDRSNEQQTRRSIETSFDDIDRKLSSLLTTFGTLAAGIQDITLANGSNNDVSVGYATYVRISGPSAAFTITGFAGAEQGRVLILRNTTTQDMTIANESASSTAAYRIITQSGSDVLLKGGSGGSSAIFLYDSTTGRWIMVGEEVSAHVFSTLIIGSGGYIQIGSTQVLNETTLRLASAANILFTDTLTLDGGRLKLDAGTTSAEPLLFQSGTNLTSPADGAMEYNGTSLLFTPVGAQRGVVPARQFYRLNSALAGSNGTGAQSLLGVGCTLSASTVYAFQLVFSLTKSAGTTSHTIAFGFGGTATITNISYQIFYTLTVPAPGVGATPSLFQTSSAGSTVYTNAITKASVQYRQIIMGTVSVNAGGTLIPQYTLSAAPGGAYSTDLGSFMTIYPISASGANTNVGTWA